MLKKIFALGLAITLLSRTACSPTPTPSSSIASDTIADTIEQYRPEILSQMQQDNVPGLAIAVVDDHNVLWAEGFGYTDWDHRIPIAPNTLFSIQSMSKSFTATAVMFAIQEGLVELDEPITTYLPDFQVNSIFEEHPEQKITLRLLLSHTAGFTHEAPYGSNYDHPAYSFEKHIASISDTWLMFPVGTRYSYSNLGLDLAGYILQLRSGMPFIQYVQQKVLDPLGMKDSTLDVNRIRTNAMRAVGHTPGNFMRPPVDFLLIPSGGVWTTAVDMAHYLQFHINKGALEGNRLLQEDLAETMYTPPNMPAQGAYQDSSYTLGITVNIRNGARHFQHGGGGFGFNSSMVWYPELKLGAVVLCNAELSDDFVVRVNEAVLDNIINKSPTLYAQLANSAVRVDPAYPPAKKENILSDDALQRLIKNQTLTDNAAAERRRKALVGMYIFVGPDGTVEISDYNSTLAYSYLGYTGTLTEVEPGLYFSPWGDALDVRGRTPTFANIHLVKLDARTRLLQSAFYAFCGLVFLSALFHRPMRALIRRIRRGSASVEMSTVAPPRSPWLVWMGILAALASLFSLLWLAFIAVTPNMMYILASLPLWRPYVDLLWWQFALLSLPFVSLALAVVIALLAGLGMRGPMEGRAIRLYYSIVALALLTFNLAIIL
jgi:CubicO group peptidase (beta-lactamase class C family)